MSTENPQQQSQPLQESIEELYDQAPCGYLTAAIDGRILKVNHTFLDWLGYEYEEVTEKKCFVDLLTVGGRMYFETHFNLLLRIQDSVNEIALDFIRKDGRVLPTLINARQKRDTKGEPVLNRFTIFNATERRQYERDLVAARDLLQTTLSSIGDAVVATDIDGRVTFMNAEAERLSGWSEDDARGRLITEVLVLQREDDKEAIENPNMHAIRVGEIVGLANHTVLIGKDGRLMTVDDSASPIRNANGEVIGGVLVFRDVTERRKEQRELAEAQALAQSVIVELRRSNDDLSQFASVASHDLRSPLNTVVQFAQLLELKYAKDLGEGKELLGVLLSAAKRMGRLVEDLLRYARVGAELSTSPAPVDANEQLGVALQNLEASIARGDAVITHDPLPAVRIDETYLAQLFQNLIGNAIHYRAAAPPRIHIGVTSDDMFWRFSCSDNGIGIAPQYHEQVFEPFKRLHGHDKPGSGIGLAICKKVIERFGGRIWVDSQEGRGSTFFFTLPKTST